MAKAVLITTPDGQKVRIGIPPGATPEQIDAKIAEVKTQFLSSATSTPTTESDPLNRNLHRPLATAAGGVIGGTAASLAAAPSAVVSGPAGPFMAGIGGAGLGAGIGGQAFDTLEYIVDPMVPVRDRIPEMRRLMGREAPVDAGAGLGAVAGDVFNDVTAGAAGEAGGQVAGALIGRGWNALQNRMAPDADARAVMDAARRQDIPLAGSDVSQSRTARRIENLPSYFTIGSGRVQRFREGQVGATEAAVQRVGDSLADAQADALTVGLKAQGGARAAMKAFRQQSQQLFGDINALAGDEPIVGTSNLRSVAESIVQAGERTKLGSVGPAARLAEHGAEAGPLQAYAGRLQELGLSDEAAQALAQAATAERIPFAVARQIEAELGDAAFRGPSIGGPRAGQLKALYSAVRSDLDEFLTSDAGNEIAPALAEAKQVYSTGKQLFNDSAKRIILGGRHSPLAPERVAERAFRPGQIEPTIEFKLLVDDETYQQATKVWMDHVVEKSTVQGQFSPAKFATEIARWEKNGHLDVILPPAQAKAVREIAQVSRAMTNASRLAGNPSGTAQGLTSVATLAQPARRAIGGDLLGAAGDVVSMTGVPALVARGAFSQPGRTLLGGGVPDLPDILGPEGMRILSQLIASQQQEAQ